jgi:hypothetical protein
MGSSLHLLPTITAICPDDCDCDDAGVRAETQPHAQHRYRYLTESSLAHNGSLLTRLDGLDGQDSTDLRVSLSPFGLTD